MKRGAARISFSRRWKRSAHAVPGIALRTSFIVGFPGESLRDFDLLEEFIGEARFDWLGVFNYSDEEGSGAFSLDSKVPKRTIEARKRRLMKLQQSISKRAKQQWVGRELVLLAEGESEETPLLWEGRTAVSRTGDRRQGLHQRLRRIGDSRARPLLPRRDHRSARLRSWLPASSAVRCEPRFEKVLLRAFDQIFQNINRLGAEG